MQLRNFIDTSIKYCENAFISDVKAATSVMKQAKITKNG